MTEYNRVTLIAENSPLSDYATSLIKHNAVLEDSNPEVRVADRIEVATTAQTYTLSHLNSCAWVLVENTDSANSLLVSWYTEIGSQAAAGGGFTFASGPPDTITDVGAAGTLLTNGATNGGFVRVTLANTGANNGTYLVQLAAADVLTLEEAATVTPDVGDGTALLTFLERCQLLVPAGSSILVGPVDPANNLTLTAKTSAITTRISYAGT